MCTPLPVLVALAEQRRDDLLAEARARRLARAAGDVDGVSTPPRYRLRRRWSFRRIAAAFAG